MGIRKLSAWSTHADNHAWRLVGNDLKELAVEAVGGKVVDSQFGNILGWLRDCGEYELAANIKQAIDTHNAKYECPACHSGLAWDNIAHRWHCGNHGYVDGGG